MKWSDNLRTLCRGVKLGTRVAKAKLAKPRIEPHLAEPEVGRVGAIEGFGDNP
jgi:hypothetical protein